MKINEWEHSKALWSANQARSLPASRGNKTLNEAEVSSMRNTKNTNGVHPQCKDKNKQVECDEVEWLKSR